jgi:hypothetical protein
MLTSLEDDETGNGDSGSLSGLVEGRAGGQPAHADGAVAVVPDIKGLEWDGLSERIVSVDHISQR